MPFSVHDLRYHLDEHYPSLTAYLQQRAQRYLGQLAFDVVEVDQVVGHVIEQLTHLHILGGGGETPKSALDELSNAQFYAFLNRAVKNKCIDRLRKHRLQITTLSELAENSEEATFVNDYLTESLWGETLFTTPEDAVLDVTFQKGVRRKGTLLDLESKLLSNCIEKMTNNLAQG